MNWRIPASRRNPTVCTRSRRIPRTVSRISGICHISLCCRNLYAAYPPHCHRGYRNAQDRGPARVAAEQVVLADECIEAFRDIPNVAARLVDAPIWTFWWD